MALESGVDVLAHAPETVEGVKDALSREIVDHHMAMIPTLKLFSGESEIERKSLKSSPGFTLWAAN